MHAKRILVSILVGALFPIIYAAAGGLLVDYVLPAGSDTTYISGVPAPGLMFAPIAIPVYFDTVLRSYDFFGYWLVFDNDWFRRTFFILFNFVFYAVATYLLLRRLGWFSSGPASPGNSADQASETGPV